MNIEPIFEFNHSQLSLVDLRNNGISGTKELEEVISGDCFVDPGAVDEIKIATGFTKSMHALIIAFMVSESGVIITLQAEKASIEDVKSNFCKYCQ